MEVLMNANGSLHEYFTSNFIGKTAPKCPPYKVSETRVARFVLVHDIKTEKMYQINAKINA
jgi:hypothetical protein